MPVAASRMVLRRGFSRLERSGLPLQRQQLSQRNSAGFIPTDGRPHHPVLKDQTFMGDRWATGRAICAGRRCGRLRRHHVAQLAQLVSHTRHAPGRAVPSHGTPAAVTVYDPPAARPWRRSPESGGSTRARHRSPPCIDGRSPHRQQNTVIAGVRCPPARRTSSCNTAGMAGLKTCATTP